MNPTKSPTYCVLPWIHQNLSVNGWYKPCCNSHSRYKDVTVKNATLQEAFVSKEATTLRTQLTMGLRPIICDTCWVKEDAGVWSYRQAYNEKFSELIPKDNNPILKYIDMKFDNVCNFQCRMCDPDSSDQIWKSIDLLNEKGLELPNHIGKYTEADKNFDFKQTIKKDYVKEVLETIDIFKVTGGEPFLSKDFLEILDLAIEKDLAKNITLMITTNASKFVKKVLDKFVHFKRVEFTVSVDGGEGVYDYIRYPYSFKQFTRRMDEAIQFAIDTGMKEQNKMVLKTACVVQAYNWLNLKDLVDYIKTLERKVSEWRLLERLDFELDLNPRDSELHPRYLPDHILDLGLERFKQTGHRQVEDFEGFVAYHKANRQDEMEFKNHQLLTATVNFDEVRNQSYKTLDPVLVEWLNTLKT
jgi:MoaA/NifB/PqqE/SkfB family radical SAM enzyme